MVRAQVYFNEQEYEAIRKAAFKERVSISALLRRLVDEQLLHRKRRKTGASGLLSLAGLIRDSKPDVARHHDDYLWGKES